MSKWPENFMTCSPREILNALNAAAAERNIGDTYAQLEKGTKINRIAWSNSRRDLRSLYIFIGWNWIAWYQITFLKPATTLNDAVDYHWADASKIEKEWLIEQVGAYPLESAGQNRPSFSDSSSGIRKNDLRWAKYVKRAYNLTFKATAGISLQGEFFRINSTIASITGNVAFRYQDNNYVDHDETLTNVVFDEYGDAFTTIAPATSRIRAAYGFVDYSCPGGFEYLDIDNQSNQ